MTAHTITEIGKTPTQIRESLISRLVDELVFLSQEIRAIPVDENEGVAEEPLWERHWATRALINRTPARTRSDFKLKFAVFKEEAERDSGFECEVMGSARELAKSLVEDALALLAVDHEDGGVTEKAD